MTARHDYQRGLSVRDGRRRGAARHAYRGRPALSPGKVRAALAIVAVLTLGVTVTAPGPGEAAWTDRVAAATVIGATNWTTKAEAQICITGSDESRPDEVFTYKGSAPLGNQGWGEIVDKNNATTTAEFAGCAVMLFAGENLGVTANKYPLLMEWYRAGGKVMTTGNDAGGNSVSGVFLMPDILVGGAPRYANIPYGGAIRADAQADSVVPAFPRWTPGTNPAMDTYATTLLPAAGSVCVATTRTDGTCAALIQKNAAGGRWAHIHTKIGSLKAPGDYELADAALAWLIKV